MDSIWNQSIELMTMGMGSVFIFLTLLVICVTLMSAVINRFVNTEQPNPRPITSNTTDPEVAAAAVSAWLKSQSQL